MIGRTLLVLILVLAAVPCHAFRVAVLQVGEVAVFEEGFRGFLVGLEKQGIRQGENLTIERHTIKAALDAGLWDKIFILARIRSTASEIVESKPDLVLTIGTPATEYGKGKIIKAGIPLVFTCVADPRVVGAESMEIPGPGFTGGTIYIDPAKVLKVIRSTLPDRNVLGIVHSDDDNAIAYCKEIEEKAEKMGMRVIRKEISKSSDIEEPTREVMAAGANVFAVPPDSYYAIDGNRHSKTIAKVTREKKIPIVVFMASGAVGGILYMGADIELIGTYSGEQAAKILKEKIEPSTLPIARQEKVKLKIDPESFKAIGIPLPLQLLKMAEKFEEK